MIFQSNIHRQSTELEVLNFLFSASSGASAVRLERRKRMKTFLMTTMLTAVLFFMSIADLPNSSLRLGFVKNAEAIIGMPWTPYSFAGAARRSMYAEAAYGAAAANAAAMNAAAANAAYANAAAAPAAATNAAAAQAAAANAAAAADAARQAAA